MLKAFCDICSIPLAPDDSQIAIQQMRMQIYGKRLGASELHFCGKTCLNKFIDEASNRPMILAPSDGQIING